MARSLWWDEEDAEHIRTRSVRYPGAVDLEPAWTLEAAADRTAWYVSPTRRAALDTRGLSVTHRALARCSR